MITKQIKIPGGNLAIPVEWQDITADLSPGAPLTLARPTGVGCIQFSSGKYISGTSPSISETDLFEMLISLCKSEHVIPGPVATRSDKNKIVATTTSETDEELIVLWVCSDRNNTILITYTNLAPRHPKTKDEVAQVVAIVDSIIML